MANLRYFYQTNIYGEPIPGTNVNIHNKPRTFGAGQRWVEFIPAGQAAPCCEDGSLLITSLGKKWRYYVRLRDSGVAGSASLPIAGSLEKHQQKPTSWQWQEVVGRHQCATTAQWNATITLTASPQVLDLATLLNLSADYYTFVADSGSTDDGHYTYTLLTDGTLTVVTLDPDVTDTITLQYSNGTCSFAFQMTFVNAT